MKRIEKLPELLAPAGSFECLIAAVSGGADAVYLGGKRFGARAYAKNFDLEEMSRAVAYCHLHGVKLYVTVNVLFDDSELAELVEYVAQLYRIGVDAVIIADLGAIAEIKKYVPNMELHASTQMSVHNTYGADAAFKLGCTRAVLARELSLDDIRKITAECKAEIEVFLHGALCVCHSGQCLFSSMVGGRSGNRGECAQPCRLPYNGGKYPLSLKDLSLADHVRELVDSGVSSLKIEGRMKSADYVYTVVSTYRKLLDQMRGATPGENEKLRRAFSRDGFTDGYFKDEITVPMTGVRSDEDKEDSRRVEQRIYEPEKIKVTAKAKMILNEPSQLTLTDGYRTVTVIGDTPAIAERAPLCADAVKDRLSKMGNTYLSLSPEDIELTLDDEINLSPGAINALRRNAVAELEGSKRELEPISYQPAPSLPTNDKPLRTAQFLREGELYSLIKAYPNSLSDFDIVFAPITSSEEILTSINGIYIPPVIRENEISKVRSALEKAQKCGIMYALVGNIGHLKLVEEFNLTPIGDFRLNITNSPSRNVYRSFGIDRTLLSAELTLPKVRDIGGGVITYGRIPLMLTERCFIRESFTCSGCESAYFTDRMGQKFPLIREFEHRNLILNSAVTYMGDRAEELKKYRINHTHFLFTVERFREIKDVLDSYKLGRQLSGAVRRVGRRENTKK